MTSENIFLLLAFFIPVVAFTYIGLTNLTLHTRDQTNSIDIDEYFLVGGEATESNYIHSSVAYNLQISTTFYFVYWGYNYGLSNVFYLFAWAAGIYIFQRASPQLLSFRKNYETLPSLLQGTNGPALRVLSAVLSIVALIGLVYVEAYFAAEFTAAAVFPDLEGNSTAPWWAVHFESLRVLRRLLQLSQAPVA